MNVLGSAGNDVIGIASVSGEMVVSGVAAATHLAHADTALDGLTLFAGFGDDSIDASGLGADRILLTLNGGSGNDTVTGSSGDDLVSGGQGNDVAFLGAGNDSFVWNPGDGSDLVEGGAGLDTLAFNGSNIAETIGISANGDRVRFTRDVAAITMDLNGLERIDFRALGGADRITVGDLRHTGTQAVNIDLAGTPGVADGAFDQVTVNGGGAKDSIALATQGSAVVVTGLSATVSIDHADGGLDMLTISAGGGADQIDAAGVAAGAIKLLLDGGEGDDVLVGGAGGETFLGGLGADNFAFSGANGVDRIMDFADNLDHIRLAGYGAALDSFGDLAGAITQFGTAVLIDLGAVVGAGLIAVDNLLVSQVDASDFLFA